MIRIIKKNKENKIPVILTPKSLHLFEVDTRRSFSLTGPEKINKNVWKCNKERNENDYYLV